MMKVGADRRSDMGEAAAAVPLEGSDWGLWAMMCGDGAEAYLK